MPKCGRLLLLALALALASCGRARSPNVVLIIGDAVGWADYGFIGSPVARTPWLDSLADQGTVFTHAYAAASFAKRSLPSLLVGMEPFALELRQRRFAAVPMPWEPAGTRYDALPRLLAARGYATLGVGQLGEGNVEQSGFGAGSGGPMVAPLLAFIDAHTREPFFAWYAPALPHPPYPAGEGDEPAAAGALAPDLAAYHAGISRLDDAVGAILTRLEQRGLRERTLVFYVSASGWDAVTAADPAERAAVGGGRGAHTIYELGFRTPLLASWPGVLPQGARDDALVSDVDLFATILDFAGAKIPARSTSRSLRPRLEGHGGAARERIFAETPEYRDPAWRAADGPAKLLHLARAWFVRTPEWRFVWYSEGDRSELYRIEEDPTEQHDVAAEHPDVTGELRDALAQAIADMDRAVDRDREMAQRIDAFEARRAEARRQRRAP
jgi:uncharacterized sulfatase